MDFESGKQQLIIYVKKYRYVILALLLGLIIMLLPESKPSVQNIQPPEKVTPVELEYKLGQILSQIAGVGKAEVLLTEACGSETIFQTDSGKNTSGLDTVILTDSSRAESGLVKQILPPSYRGALVVCRGADSASVRLAVVEAVRSVTGLSFDCITVLKMK